MAYNLIVLSRAQNEIANAVDYYALYSNDTPLKFITELNNTYEVLRANPFFAVRYKNVRTLKLKRFPYTLYFIVNDKNSTVNVLSCFHNKQNPYKRSRI